MPHDDIPVMPADSNNPVPCETSSLEIPLGASEALQAIGTIIRNARRESGLTQQELAHRMGVRQQYVSHLEQGVVENPSFETLRRLADALGKRMSLTVH